MPDFSFARIRHDDADTVASLITDAFGAIAVTLDPALSAWPTNASQVLAVLAAAGGGGSMARCSGAAPAWQRHGLAKRLLALGEQVARDGGYRAVTLSTRLALAGNLALFRACGFRQIGERAHPGYHANTIADFHKILR